jgi:hypothetical protein
MRGSIFLLLVITLVAGCASTGQLSANTETTDFSLDAAALRTEGIGFLTPTSATGQEANRMSLALAFSNELSARNLKVVSLAEVLSAVNQAGLTADYKSMVDDYDATGIMEKETLRRIGEVSGSRYLGLLGLADFEQETNKRFGIGGLRLLDTKVAGIRLSWQIWDSAAGTIAWEGSDEIHYAYETGRERPVSFNFVAEQAAANLISRIPLAADVPERAASVMATP